MESPHFRTHMFIWTILTDVRIHAQSFISKADYHQQKCINIYQHVDYLKIYIAYFEVTKDVGRCQDLFKSHPEDGSNIRCVLGKDWLPNEHILKLEMPFWKKGCVPKYKWSHCP